VEERPFRAVKRSPSPPVVLSDSEGASRSEEESKDPDHAYRAMPIQGVLPRISAPSATDCNRADQSKRRRRDHRLAQCGPRRACALKGQALGKDEREIERRRRGTICLTVLERILDGRKSSHREAAHCVFTRGFTQGLGNSRANPPPAPARSWIRNLRLSRLFGNVFDPRKSAFIRGKLLGPDYGDFGDTGV